MISDVLAWPFWYDLAAAIGLLVAAWVSVIHSGSYLNTLMPGYVACAGIGGCAFGLLHRRGGLLGVALATALVALQTVSLIRHEYPNRAIPTTEDRRAGAELETALRKLPGPVLVLRHPWYGTVAGKEPASPRPTASRRSCAPRAPAGGPNSTARWSARSTATTSEPWYSTPSRPPPGSPPSWPGTSACCPAPSRVCACAHPRTCGPGRPMSMCARRGRHCVPDPMTRSSRR